MIRVGGWLERWLLAAVLVVGGVAVADPGPGRWADGHGGIDAALVVLVLASGLAIPAGAGAALRRLAPRLLVIIAAGTIALPLLADALGQLLEAGPLRDGVLAVGVAPAEVASIGLSGLAGGDVAVAAALLATSALVSVGTAGPILSLLGSSGVAPGHVVVQLVAVVGLPLGVGLAARPAVVAGDPERVRTVLAALGLASTAALLVLVGLVAAQVRFDSAYLGVALVLVALVAISAAGGRLLGRLLPAAAARSALLHVSMRDFAIASGIAAAAFGPQATGPLGLYGVLVIVWGTLVASWSTRRGADRVRSR